MAVVTVATTKGGVGKSTTVTNLAVAAWADGYSVKVFDCDPQRHSQLILGLYKQALPEGTTAQRQALDVEAEATEADIVKKINVAAKDYDLVLIDLQGSANQIMLLAFARSDLVIIPVQPSALDIGGAVAAWSSVQSAAEIRNRDIATRILFCRTPAAIQPKVLKETRARFTEKGLAVMRAEFVERAAFKALTFSGEMPTDFAPASPAAENIRAIYNEVLQDLEAIMQGEPA
ncbi:ParA family protein [Telmatospirillum sp. J64-1]|uniref:ParA family protein n=1 Tax=Telmatospirillum sp. J64-1 TaxID=2502183 RepID=UPI00115C7557|nr:ParA family protein [Telmatospirillum sp. J64-1]